MDKTIEAHFVTFTSPGTFVAEETTRSVAAWDVAVAQEMAKEIVERHGARPYGFFFTTRSRGPEDLDSKVTARSPFYYLGGKVETLAEVKARGDARDRILIANMEGNGWDRVVVTANGYRWTQPLRETDVVLT